MEIKFVKTEPTFEFPEKTEDELFQIELSKEVEEVQKSYPYLRGGYRKGKIIDIKCWSVMARSICHYALIMYEFVDYEM